MNKIYLENCVDTMSRMEENSIDLVVTSPPYDDLRDYNKYSFDFDKVSSLLFKVIKVGGVLVWVVADTTKDCDESGTSFKQALAFKSLGFKLNDTMIYSKKNSPMPSKYKYYSNFEYMFVFSKIKCPVTVNLLKDKKNSCAGEVRKNSNVRTKDGIKFKKDRHLVIGEYGVRTNIWEYDVGWMKSYKDKFVSNHPAVFPEKLAEDHVLSWSNKGEIVYDPFMGSGTTLIVAKNNKRKFIGNEINAEYYEYCKTKLF